MLRELEQLGRHFRLEPLGYEKRVTYWEIDLESKTIQQLLQEGETSKPGKPVLVPDLRRNSDEPLLIDDAAEYVFGIGDRGEKRHQLYCELLNRCWQDTQDEGVRAVQQYLETVDCAELDRQISALRPAKKKRDGTEEQREVFWWARDNICFTLNGKPVTHRQKVQDFWADYYLSKQDTIPGICLLTGQETQTVGRKMPLMLKGVPGTQSSGAAITSFDKAAYQSFGNEGNANAPIGFEASVRLLRTLQLLLNAQINHYNLGDQAFVFWGDQDGEGINPEFWNDPAAAVAHSLFASPNRPYELPSNRALSKRFYLAGMKGASGRIALTSWNDYDAETLKANAIQFVERQRLGQYQALPVWKLRKVAFREPKKEFTDRIVLALVKNALLGHPLPDEFARRICDRICQEQDFLRDLARVQALQLYLKGYMDTEKLRTIPKDSDRLPPEQVAYILGRIAFLMHWSQKTGQKMEKEDTNVMRSLRAFSTTPASVFGRLYNGCIAHHLQERDANQGAIWKLKTAMDEEFSRFGLGFNPTFDLPDRFGTKEQACFFLGFGTKRSEYFSKQTNTDDEE